MNRCMFMGRLTRDVESREVGSSAVYSFSIAVNKTFKKKDGSKGEEVTFVDLEAWDKGGEVIQEYFSKGDGIIVLAEFKLDTWEKEGVKHSRPKFRVTEFWFPAGKSGQGQGKSEGGGEAKAEKLPKADKPSEVKGNEDIPF